MKNCLWALFFQTFYNEIKNQFSVFVHTSWTDNTKEFHYPLFISRLILELHTEPHVLTLHNRMGG